MTETRLSAPHPAAAGDVAVPPFVRLPEAAELFRARSDRFRWLARRHDLKPYLLFLAGLTDVQHRLQGTLPAPVAVHATLDRVQPGVPPLRRERLVDARALRPTLDRIIMLTNALAIPDAAKTALDSLDKARDSERDAMIRCVLATTVPAEALAEHSFIAAALQFHFTRLAEKLDAKALVPVANNVCPSCGHPPAASLQVGWRGAHGARYCGCGLCGTLWNYASARCTLCDSPKSVGYQEMESGKAIAQAETCPSCHRYVKVFRQDIDPAADILADDVASLGLDLLLRSTTFRRGACNPFLLGY